LALGFVSKLGTLTIRAFWIVGRYVAFVFNIIKTLFTTRPHVQNILMQMKYIGVESSTIVILTATFAGMALTLQTCVAIMKLGAFDLLGIIVALGMTREIGPILTGLMVNSRAGSAMAAEIGTMKVTEQIDALKTLCINPFQYLVVPRIIASIFVMPCLTLFSIICGIAGGYVFCTYALQINPELYIMGIRKSLTFADIRGGLIKGACFGFIISTLGTYHGFQTTGGARGVGRATTQTVVASAIAILIANFFLGSILFPIGL